MSLIQDRFQYFSNVLYFAYINLSGDTFQYFQIRMNLEKLKFEFLSIINVACVIDGITAGRTTFVCVFKAQGIVSSDILRS